MEGKEWRELLSESEVSFNFLNSFVNMRSKTEGVTRQNLFSPLQKSWIRACPCLDNAAEVLADTVNTTNIIIRLIYDRKVIRMSSSWFIRSVLVNIVCLELRIRFLGGEKTDFNLNTPSGKIWLENRNFCIFFGKNSNKVWIF